MAGHVTVWVGSRHGVTTRIKARENEAKILIVGRQGKSKPSIHPQGLHVFLENDINAAVYFSDPPAFQVIAHELQQSLVTLRLANVYDLSSKILLLKFAKPENKQQLIIETGFRCHLTDFARTTAAAPSAFVARLRKLLKTRRLTQVAQIGSDRILEFQFSDGHYRLFLEFFASGNIILTDAELKIIAIARNVAEGEGRMPQRVGVEYSLESTQNFSSMPSLTKERVRDALKTLAEKSTSRPEGTETRGKGKSKNDLRKGLAISLTELPPITIEHVLKTNNFDESRRISDILDNERWLDDLVACLTEARTIVEKITSSAICKGYIFAKRRSGAPDTLDQQASALKREDLMYEDFHPFIPQSFKDDPSIEALEFDGYNKTVDEFYSSLEGQKLESRLLGREEVAERKLETARREQAKRLEGLKDAQTMNARKAAAIEANVERVQEAMDAVNGLLAQGMDWVNIGKLVEREKKKDNPVAEIINLPLKLSENTITLTLAEENFDDDNDDEEVDNPFETDESASEDEDTAAMASNRGKPMAPGLKIDISLDLTPWANATEYYEQRRSAAVKEVKTRLQAARALKSTEEKIAHDLKKGLKQEKALLQPIRRQMWFEKFTWFLSSDGYLVLGGKDPHQNELLYSRYFRKGDVYCHADLRGAASVFIKNNPRTPDAPIPPATLAQAGSLCVCTSEAWESKAGMGAWWVNADQVSRVTSTGDVLPSGTFLIQGKKNFLPPMQLLLGFGVVFKVSDESKTQHAKHRIYDRDSSVGAASTLGDTEPTSVENDQTEEVVKEKEEDVDAYGKEQEEHLSDAQSEDGLQDEGQRANPLQVTGVDDDDLQKINYNFSEFKVADDDEIQEDTSSRNVFEDGASSLDTKEKDNQSDDDGEDDIDAGDECNDNGEESQNIAPDVEDSEISKAPTETSDPPLTQPEFSQKKSIAKRGQKGKAKKIAQKYKHQDDEDKAAAEALIGATAGRQRAEAEAAAKAQRQAEYEAARERRRAQHLRKQKEIAEQEKARHAMMDEGFESLGEEDMEKMTALDSLVSWPLPGDEILDAIPVCAPWNAMARFKYKVKLQPGAVKKNKAVKDILERWSAAAARKGVLDESAKDKEKIWPREAELIKGFKAEAINNCVPVSKVKVMISGGLGGGGGEGRGSGGGSGSGKGGQKSQSKGGKGGKGKKK